MVRTSSSASSTDCAPISSATLRDRRLDRHAGFHADQHQVERIRPGHLDRLLALGGAVVDVEDRRVEAAIGDDDADEELDEGRLFGQAAEQEEIDGGQREEDERQHKAEEQERVSGFWPRKPATFSLASVFSSTSARRRSSRSTMSRMPSDCSSRRPLRRRSASAASRARCLARSSSRSSATDFMRDLQRVAAEATAAR